MECRLLRSLSIFIFLVAAIGCGSASNAVDEAPPEPPPAGTATQLQSAVDAALNNPGSGGSVATMILESASSLAEANPGKEKTIAEIQGLANQAANKEAAGDDPSAELRRLKTLLGGLK